MDIVITDRIDFDPHTAKRLESMGARCYDDSPESEDELIARLQKADIAVVNFVKMNAKVLGSCPRLRYVISAAVGFDGVDTQHAASLGITVLNCPTQNVEAVAEHALALMFAVSRRIVEASLDLQAGHWNGLEMVGLELAGKRLGLVGYGRVGKFIETKVSGLGMTTRHVNSKSSDQEIDDLVGWADIVCLCTTLRAETHHLMDGRRLATMRTSALLVNVARGLVVDQKALLSALGAGKIRGAGLDVFEHEPTSGVAPDDIIALAKLPNVVATPHIAYNTWETVQRLGEELIANIASCIQGKPQNVVAQAIRSSSEPK